MYLLFLYTLIPPCRPQKWEHIFQLRLASSLLCYSMSLLTSVSTYLSDTTLRNSASAADEIVSYSLHSHVSSFSKIWARSDLVGILLASQKILQYLISIHVKQETMSFSFYSKAIFNAKDECGYEGSWHLLRIIIQSKFYFLLYDDFICQSSFNAKLVISPSPSPALNNWCYHLCHLRLLFVDYFYTVASCNKTQWKHK